MMTILAELQSLVNRFDTSLPFYNDSKNAYNEHSCRIEYIDPFLKLLGWDVANEKGLAPQYREVIAENYSTRTDRPDYTITLRGVAKFFVEAKKPSVDITKDEEVISETEECYTLKRDGRTFSIEKSILRPYFKPVQKSEKKQNTYSYLTTNKHIIFPYDSTGKVIPLNELQTNYPGTYEYLMANYDVLAPKGIVSGGKRDVNYATADTWYRYGRHQALTAFNDRKKLIVGILSKDPMYALDTNNYLIASGDTAGYVEKTIAIFLVADIR